MRDDEAFKEMTDSMCFSAYVSNYGKRHLSHKPGLR